MENLFVVILTLCMCMSCTTDDKKSASESKGDSTNTEIIVGSLLFARHHAEQTGILSRKLPEISREQAIGIQLDMLKKELNSGARFVGWKMGGTITDDSTNYDPMFGYILDSNVIEQHSVLSPNDFPEGKIMVEGEIGFVMEKDFKKGADSIEELKNGIDHIVNAVELVQDTAIPIKGHPETKNTNHALAAGLGQVGFILGAGQAAVDDFNMKNEVVKCFINDTMAAEGISTRVYGGPLNALYSLANLLPKYDMYLKKGDIIITGSLYDNPTVDSTAKVEVTFSTLGSINFSMK